MLFHYAEKLKICKESLPTSKLIVLVGIVQFQVFLEVTNDDLFSKFTGIKQRSSVATVRKLRILVLIAVFMEYFHRLKSSKINQ